MTKTKILVLYTAGTGSTHKGSINQFYFANCAHLSVVLQKQHYSAKHYRYTTVLVGNYSRGGGPKAWLYIMSKSFGVSH